MKAGNKLPRDVTEKRKLSLNFLHKKSVKNCENHQHAYENCPLKDQLPDLQTMHNWGEVLKSARRWQKDHHRLLYRVLNWQIGTLPVLHTALYFMDTFSFTNKQNRE
jgi:hypothetical protein